MGWESLFRCAYYSSVWQCLWPCKIPARKNSTQVLPGVIGKKKFKYFPRRDTQARSYSKFQNQGPVLSSQNVQIPCQNVQIHRHDKENVILIRRRGVAGEIPRNSRETLPCPDLSRQMVSREKIMSLCSYQSAFPVSCAQCRRVLFFTNPVSEGRKKLFTNLRGQQQIGWEEMVEG